MPIFARMIPPAAVLVATVAIGLSLDAAADLSASVAYPDGYRDWRHIKSMVIQSGHPLYESFGGIHHLYANDKAIEGYASGKFPDGAVIVFDLLDVASADSAMVEGRRKVLGVMEKNALRFAATGGWGFEGFAGGDPDQRAVGDKAAEACFGCHTSQKASDYVFSRMR